MKISFDESSSFVTRIFILLINIDNNRFNNFQKKYLILKYRLKLYSLWKIKFYIVKNKLGFIAHKNYNSNPVIFKVWLKQTAISMNKFDLFQWVYGTRVWMYFVQKYEDRCSRVKKFMENSNKSWREIFELQGMQC